MLGCNDFCHVNQQSGIPNMRGKSRSTEVLLMEEIPNNHLGRCKVCKWWDKLSTSPGDRGISEPSKVSQAILMWSQVGYQAATGGLLTPEDARNAFLSSSSVWEKSHHWSSNWVDVDIVSIFQDVTVKWTRHGVWNYHPFWMVSCDCWMVNLRTVWQSFLPPVFWRDVMCEIDFQSQEIWWVLLC